MSRGWAGPPAEPGAPTVAATGHTPAVVVTVAVGIMLAAVGLGLLSSTTAGAEAPPVTYDAPRVGPEIALDGGTLLTVPERGDVYTGCHEGTRLFLYAGDVELVAGDLSCSGIGPSVGAVPPGSAPSGSGQS